MIMWTGITTNRSNGNTCRVWNNSSEHSNKGNEHPGYCASWNSDETMILTSSNANPSIWDAKTGTFIIAFKTGHDVASAVNDDGTKLFVIDYYKWNSGKHSVRTEKIQVWDVKTSQLVKEIRSNYFTGLIAWNSPRNMIASLLPES
jgi:hypothetical protein